MTGDNKSVSVSATLDVFKVALNLAGGLVVAIFALSTNK